MCQILVSMDDWDLFVVPWLVSWWLYWNNNMKENAVMNPTLDSHWILLHQASTSCRGARLRLSEVWPRVKVRSQSETGIVEEFFICFCTWITFTFSEWMSENLKLGSFCWVGMPQNINNCKVTLASSNCYTDYNLNTVQCRGQTITSTQCRLRL